MKKLTEKRKKEILDGVVEMFNKCPHFQSFLAFRGLHGNVHFRLTDGFHSSESPKPKGERK